MLQPYGTDEIQRNASIDSHASYSNKDQSTKTNFDAFVIKSPNPDAHGPMSYMYLAPGKEDKIDLVGEVTDLTDKLTPVLVIKQEFIIIRLILTLFLSWMVTFSTRKYRRQLIWVS